MFMQAESLRAREILRSEALRALGALLRNRFKARCVRAYVLYELLCSRPRA